MADLTNEEKHVVLLLADAWNAFVRLPVQHDDDLGEFRATIHRAQEKVLARPAARDLNRKVAASEVEFTLSDPTPAT